MDLDADFLKMFEFGYTHFGDHRNNKLQEDTYEVELLKTTISVDYSKGLPIFNLKTI